MGHKTAFLVEARNLKLCCSNKREVFNFSLFGCYRLKMVKIFAFIHILRCIVVISCSPESFSGMYNREYKKSRGGRLEIFKCNLKWIHNYSGGLFCSVISSLCPCIICVNLKVKGIIFKLWRKADARPTMRIKGTKKICLRWLIKPQIRENQRAFSLWIHLESCG